MTSLSNRLLFLGIVFSLLFFPSLALADTVDVPYIRDITFEIDTEDGPLQCIVESRVGRISEELNAEGETDTQSDVVIRAVIVANDVKQGWIVAATISQEAVGVWDLHPGDSCTGLKTS